MADLAPGSKPFVLVPLYIYPFPTAWDPLYLAVDTHPELDFLVVVNPGSGPGPGVLPDANYIEALARLTAAPNVKVIGYVHCSYGKRLLDQLVADVSAYRGWTHASESRDDAKVCVVLDWLSMARCHSAAALGLSLLPPRVSEPARNLGHIISTSQLTSSTDHRCRRHLLR